MLINCRVCKLPYENGCEPGESDDLDCICGRCFKQQVLEEDTDHLEGAEGDSN